MKRIKTKLSKQTLERNRNLRKKTTRKELFFSLAVLLFLFLTSIPTYLYIEKGVPYIFTLKQWEKMTYDLPINTSREALAYAKEASESKGYKYVSTISQDANRFHGGQKMDCLGKI